MLPRNHPDRIQIAFDDPRLVANAGLILPVTLAGRLGLSQLVDNHVDLGDAPGRANTGDKILTLVASALAGGDCIDDTDVLRAGRTSSVLGCVVKAPSTLGTFLRSFRWGHVRQLDRVSRELLARAWDAGAGPGDSPLMIDIDSDGLRDLWTGKGGSAPSQLHRPAGLSSAAGRCRRNRRRADGTTAQGPSQHRPGRSQLPAGDGGASAPRRCHGSAHGAGRQRLLCPHHRCRLSQDGCTLLHHHPTAPPTAQSHRGHTRDGLDTHTLLDGRRSLRCRDHLHSLRQSTRRRTSAPHRPKGEAHARLPTGVFHQLQLSRFHHGPRGRHPPTGSRPPPTRRGGERHPRPEVRRRTEPSALGTLCRQRRLVSRAGDGSQSGSLDLPHRTGRTSLHHQDPAQTVLLPRRTAYTLGPLSHPASSPALALGNTVRPRSGQTANHSVTELTADGDDCPPYTP